MYTILVPLDNDGDRAQTQSNFVSDLPGDPSETRVVLTHVMEGKERSAPESMRRVDRVDTVRSTRETLESAGYEVETVEAGSPPAEGILDLAEELDADLVVVGGRKRSPTGKAVFGSVTQSIILNGDVPVTVTAANEA